MTTLSNRLRTELIREDEHLWPDLHALIRNNLRVEQRDRIKPTIANIEADLKGMLPEPYCASCGYPDQRAEGYNEAIAEMIAAIDNYCKKET